MNLNRYIEELRQQLLVAAEASGDDARQLAERLVAPLQPAVQLVLLDALSDAAAEITRELAPGSVEVRLRGREPEFVVTPPTVDVPADETARPERPSAPSPTTIGAIGDGDDGGTARVTLRLPEALKQRIEEAATRDGLSVNSWLVRNLDAVVDPTDRGAPAPRRGATGGDRFTGWAQA